MAGAVRVESLTPRRAVREEGPFEKRQKQGGGNVCFVAALVEHSFTAAGCTKVITGFPAKTPLSEMGEDPTPVLGSWLPQQVLLTQD